MSRRRIILIVIGVIAVCFCGVIVFGTYLGSTPEGQANSTARAEESEATRSEETAVAIAEATEEARPTNTPLPTDTPEPTPTPEPSASPIPDPTSAGIEDSPVGDEALVTHIVDGDTIDVEMGGQTYRVRYIGIDTPERGEPFYDEAAVANANLVSEKTVILHKDISETDSFGRLLRYVYLSDGTFVNGELVKQGYAEAVAYDPDIQNQDLLGQLQDDANASGLGIWGQVIAEPPTLTPVQVVPGSHIVIASVNKQSEYVDLRNDGDQPQDLQGWILISERGDQRCPLGQVLQPGGTLRVWARAADSGQGGFNCGFGDNIWNNSEPDAAVLVNESGQEVSRR